MIQSFIKNLLKISAPSIDEESTAEDVIDLKAKQIDRELTKNITLLESLYNAKKNTDIAVRNFTIGGENKEAAIFFISSSIDEQVVEEHVLKPLIHNTSRNATITNMVTARSITPCNTLGETIKEINNGNTVLFIQGNTKAYSMNTTKFHGRAVDKPANEVTIKGPDEAFNEDIETNMSLIRKKIKDENLTFEAIPVSERSHNTAYITYIHDLTSDELINAVKERLEKLDVASIPNISVLEQYIEESPLSLFPTLLYTERPDRAAKYLENGHVVLLMENSPSSLILPATFWSFFHTEEDDYNRFAQVNFTRILRILALFVAMSISAYYVAVTHFHAEMLPHELLLAIVSTREKVPFPPLVEVLVMQGAFELIREAGLRVPTAIGPTIGIVGALILGQAAVDANLVSPIVVIVVALEGLSTFTLGDVNLNFAVRVFRFNSILAAALFGILGIVAWYTIILFYLVSYKSFGVPYFAPKTPYYTSAQDTFIRGVLKNEVFRPGYVKPKDITKK